MLEDTIKAVRDAETEADAIVEEARKKAETLIADTKAQIEEEKKKTKEESAVQAQEKLRLAREEGDKTAAEAKVSIDRDAQSLKDMVAPKEEDAIQKVIQELIG